MTLRSRFNLLFLFVALVPFTLPLMGYIYFKLTIPDSVVQEITAAPPFVTKDLHRIIDKTIPKEEIDDRIMIVVYGKDNPVYINDYVQRFILENNFSRDNRIELRNGSLELLTALNTNHRKALIGNALFSYHGVPGLVFFRFDHEDPLLHILGHPLTAMTAVFVVIILIPLFISSRFLISLRRSLSHLEKGAARISMGNLATEMPVPADPELQPVFEAFEEMRRRLKEDQLQQSRFIMSVSHDLKTPLTSIRGFVEAMEDGVVEDETQRRRYYSVIREKTELLEERITELIEVIKISTEGWQRGFAEIPAYEFLGSLFERYKLEAESRQVKFESTLDFPKNMKIRGDRKMLTRAIENLLDNAVRYSGENPRIMASATLKKKDLSIRIEDSGPGIDDSDAPHLFKPFYRGDKSRNSRGIGLGLSSVKEIAEAHGGSVIIAESSLGGAGIEILLPVLTSG